MIQSAFLKFAISAIFQFCRIILKSNLIFEGHVGQLRDPDPDAGRGGASADLAPRGAGQG